MVVVGVVVVVGLGLPMVLVGHLVQRVRLVQLGLLVVLVVRVVLRVLGHLLVLEVQLVLRVLGLRVVLGLLVGLVVVVVVVERLVHNRLERKRVHRNLDKGQRKLLVISFPFHVGFQPWLRQ